MSFMTSNHFPMPTYANLQEIPMLRGGIKNGQKIPTSFMENEKVCVH